MDLSNQIGPATSIFLVWKKQATHDITLQFPHNPTGSSSFARRATMRVWVMRIRCFQLPLWRSPEESTPLGAGVSEEPSLIGQWLGRAQFNITSLLGSALDNK